MQASPPSDSRRHARLCLCLCIMSRTHRAPERLSVADSATDVPRRLHAMPDRYRENSARVAPVADRADEARRETER